VNDYQTCKLQRKIIDLGSRFIFIPLFLVYLAKIRTHRRIGCLEIEKNAIKVNTFDIIKTNIPVKFMPFGDVKNTYPGKLKLHLLWFP